MKKSRHQFNMALNDDDYAVLRTLKDKYSININGCLKGFLKSYLKQLEGGKVDPLKIFSGETESERQKFLTEEWPAMVTRIRQLGLDTNDLLQSSTEKEGDT